MPACAATQVTCLQLPDHIILLAGDGYVLRLKKPGECYTVNISIDNLDYPALVQKKRLPEEQASDSFQATVLFNRKLRDISAGRFNDTVTEHLFSFISPRGYE
ncbi:hypothetical protein EG830_07090, partial [bacterium]|nr:hypothetical protein [bacterium]